LRLRALPGYSALFMDFVDNAAAAQSFLPFRPDRETLLSHAARARDSSLPREKVCALLDEQASELGCGERVRENIRMLRKAGTVVIVTSLPPSLLGGPLCLLLRCLTAAKLAAELNQSGVPSVPLAWAQPEDGPNDSIPSISLLDVDSRLTRLSWDDSVPDMLERLLRMIHQLAPGSVDSDVVATLRSVHAPGTGLAPASAAFLTQLADDWGLLLLDPRKAGFQALAADALATLRQDVGMTAILLREHSRRLKEAGYGKTSRGSDENSVSNWLVQNSILPVAAVVAGSSDIRSFSLTLPLFHELRQTPPLCWPRVSATLVDARNRKILEKYKLRLGDLFAGKQEILHKTGLEGAERAGVTRFEGLVAGIEAGIRELAALAPEDGLQVEVRSSREKILYQLGKLKERFVSAIALRREAALRHFERACNTLAPESRPQECELAALHFLLRFSRALVPRIYEKITVWTHDHQIIDVD
jgi:uncharacterized protein YllA (UPF0747 family)